MAFFSFVIACREFILLSGFVFLHQVKNPWDEFRNRFLILWVIGILSGGNAFSQFSASDKYKNKQKGTQQGYIDQLTGSCNTKKVKADPDALFG
jgi:hypothetical protein